LYKFALFSFLNIHTHTQTHNAHTLLSLLLHYTLRHTTLQFHTRNCSNAWLLHSLVQVPYIQNNYPACSYWSPFQLVRYMHTVEGRLWGG